MWTAWRPFIKAWFWWRRCSKLHENELSLRCVKLGTQSVTLQSLSKFLWRDFGCLETRSHWLTFCEIWSLKSFGYFCRWDLDSQDAYKNWKVWKIRWKVCLSNLISICRDTELLTVFVAGYNHSLAECISWSWMTALSPACALIRVIPMLYFYFITHVTA